MYLRTVSLKKLFKCRIIHFISTGCALPAQETPRKQKLRREKKALSEKVRRAQRKLIAPAINTVSDIVKAITLCIGGLLGTFLAAICTATTKKRMQWPAAVKLLTLALFFKGPAAYRFLRKWLPLPGVSTLRAWIQNIRIDPGLQNPIFVAFNNKVKGLSDADRNCILMIDEVISYFAFYFFYLFPSFRLAYAMTCSTTGTQTPSSA